MFDDAEAGAVEGAANAIFFNHGQCCVAGSRLFVQEDRFDEVVNGVAEIAKGIKLGPGMDSGTQTGPLVSEEQLRRVTGFLDSGREDGATTITGGGRFGDSGYFVEPTVITNTRPDMKIVREEIFGPVVVAAPFRSLDEIAAEANNSWTGAPATPPTPRDSTVSWPQDPRPSTPSSPKSSPRSCGPGREQHRDNTCHRPRLRRGCLHSRRAGEPGR